LKNLEVGARPAMIPMVEGFGTDVPLADALKQITPAGWKGFASGGVDPAQRVSWRTTSVPWHLALVKLLTGNKLWGEINWDEKSVTVMPVAAATLASDQTASPSTDVSSLRPTALKATVPVQAQPPAKPEWRLEAGKTLQSNIEAWGAKAGWRVVWKPEFRYVIGAQAILNGEFEGPEGVLAQIITAYKSAERPLISEFFLGNRVVEIREAPSNYASK